ncbi:peptidase M20 [Ktedonobacter sp. SOSP1-52]|uniref:M20/M25/M40 family metallo-hydrolase n=1 Tax=Ktedonobacter sp. SOSP1-52 TaxID=2778366 RepID=UPI0019167D28|nr:M20/M25/M40 family metallo-hydrolase [Ktedonobacter sp. SOSP1-52]GHO67968.1 peptidase M20 [Ktedonobacter sp. SOSP1-52]
MNSLLISVFCVVAILVLLVGIVLVRTLMFQSKQMIVPKKVCYPLDRDQAVQRLQGAIQIQTIAEVPAGIEIDWSQFRKFEAYLQQSFPLIHSRLEKTVINDHGLLFLWRGSDDQQLPLLVTGHYDTMPATGEGWNYPPFSGAIAEGYLWGRGTLDDKGSVLAILEATEFLLHENFQPTRSIYIAFGQDEEPKGHRGAEKIAAYLQAQGLHFEAVIDEGLFTVQGMAPGLPKSIWVDLVGTAEKGFVDLKLIAHANGGHSAMPPRQTAIGILSAAINKLEKHPFPVRWTESMRELFRYLGPEMTFPFKIIFANLWLFRPVIERQLTAAERSNALMRTTTAPSIFHAGEKAATMLPLTATATVNCRLLPGDTVQSVMQMVRAIIDDPRVEVEPIPELCGEASPVISPVDTWSFHMLQKTVQETISDTLVAPSLVVGATDARHYAWAQLSTNVYRTLPLKVPQEDLAGPHGINERISLDAYVEMINYYIQLVRNFNGDSACKSQD